jgi:hypothetical protein
VANRSFGHEGQASRSGHRKGEYRILSRPQLLGEPSKLFEPASSHEKIAAGRVAQRPARPRQDLGEFEEILGSANATRRRAVQHPSRGSVCILGQALFKAVQPVRLRYGVGVYEGEELAEGLTGADVAGSTREGPLWE